MLFGGTLRSDNRFFWALFRIKQPYVNQSMKHEAFDDQPTKSAEMSSSFNFQRHCKIKTFSENETCLFQAQMTQNLKVVLPLQNEKFLLLLRFV